MTLAEYGQRLRELSPEELRRFNEAFGGGQLSVEQRETEFVHNPRHERGICQLLGLQTEDEKLTQAALRSADAADRSAWSAKWSMIWSAVACIAAVVAAVVAIMGLWSKG